MKREDRVVESQSNLDFSQTLQVVRVNFGKSQRELANFMGVSKTTLARLEKKTLAAFGRVENNSCQIGKENTCRFKYSGNIKRYNRTQS